MDTVADANADPLGATATDANSGKPIFLSSHLANHLLDVIRDSTKDMYLQCACADLARVALETQPGLFLDEANELLPKAASTCGQALQRIMKSLKADPADDGADDAVSSALAV